MSLSSHARDWEDLGTLDPLWAVLSFPERRFGRWDAEAFFRSGDQEIEQVMQTAGRQGDPSRFDTVLDFGCGVGRLAPALCGLFSSYIGVDIAASMVAEAIRYHAHRPNCQFVVNPESNLAIFDDNRFDLVYTNYVLQHQPSQRLIEAYLREFIRVLRPGGLLIFQLPDQLPLAARLEPRRRLYSLLRRLGCGNRFLYYQLGITPMRTTAVREARAVRFLSASAGQILYVQRRMGRPGTETAVTDDPASPPGANRIYFVTKQGPDHVSPAPCPTREVVGT